MDENANKKPRDKRQQGRKEIRPPKKITERYLYNSGLYYLKRYTASTHHFKTVMMRKIRNSCRHHTDQELEPCVEMLDKTTQRLCDEGFLNDAEYLRGMVTSLRRSGKSTRAILARLTVKGLAHDDIKETILTIDAQSFNPDDENPELLAAIKHARKKRLGPYSKHAEKDADITRKELSSLARAGFSYDIAKQVIDMNEID